MLAWEIHSNIMIASSHTRLSCGHEIGTTAGLSEGVVFAKRKQGNNWLRRLSEDPPDTLPPPPLLLLYDELLNSRWGWLFDLLKIYQVSLASFSWPSKLQDGGGAAPRCQAFEDKKPPNDFVGWAVWGGCQQRESTIICSKLQTHAEWHKAA